MNIIFIVIFALIIALAAIPYLFNLASGLNFPNYWGGTSDWFVLYGAIFGGLIGGFFTYLAVLLTLRHNEKVKEEETAPILDILHKNVEFTDNMIDIEPKNIGIEITNIGGSLAKNIECTLSIPKIEDNINYFINSEIKNNITIQEVTELYKKEGWEMVKKDLNTNKIINSENVFKNYDSKFVGHCIPIKFDTNAKVEYIIDSSITFWIQAILGTQNNAYRNKNNELLKLRLSIKYFNEKNIEKSDNFNLYWEYVTVGHDENLKCAVFKYILRSEEVIGEDESKVS